MIVLSSLLEHVGRLVHADARISESTYARHRGFLAMHLGLFAAAIALVPLALACGHVPGPWEAFAAAWLMVPLGAAVWVSRTGRLGPAEAACLLAWGGFALTTIFCGGTSIGGGCVLLLLAPLLACFGSDRQLIGPSLVATTPLVAALFLADLFGPANARWAAPTPVDAALVGPAILYALVLALTAAARQARAESRHLAGEQRYEALAAASGDLILRYDRMAGVVSASREAETLFGTSPRSLLGRGFFERVHVADRPAFLKMFSDAAETGRSTSARLRFRLGGEGADSRAPASFAWIEIRARRTEERPARDGLEAEGGPSEVAVLALVRDITGQREYETAMARAKEEAERANAWKDSFLANVSHELRTPLNAIIGFSEMLSSEAFSPRDPAKQREYAAIITTSGHHLLSVVNSLLDMSKIEAGRFEIRPEPFDVGELIGSCCDMVGLKAEQAGITIERCLDPELSEIVADKRACKQIVINLLSNALKFTHGGGHVTVGAKPQGNSALLTVTDTGIGIAPRDLGRLGDAFFQGQAGYDRCYEGTGLGLSVVRGLIGLHGGTITVESALGEGTRIAVRLPLDCRLAPQAATSPRIEVISRYARPTAPVVPADVQKVQKIA